MNTVKALAIMLVAVGSLELGYGSYFSARASDEPVELVQQKDKQTTDLPVWPAVGISALGGVLLLFSSFRQMHRNARYRYY